ncbi:MAG: hypothetical protein ACLFQB_14490 [Chitinispirillaceae bacterium]
MNLNPTASKKESHSFAESLKLLSSEDFDGHTGFANMTADQRLIWLSQAAQFFFEQNFTSAPICSSSETADPEGQPN